MKNITLLMACLFATFLAHAQWTPDTSVNTRVADIFTDDAQSLTAPSGNTYMVFWVAVATPEYYELRLQKLDATGNSLFGNNGKLISNTIPMSTYTSQWFISMDRDENLYIGVTGTGNSGGYAFKVDSSGDNVWSDSGIDLGGIGYSVLITPLTSGDAIISWMDGTYTGHIQKYDSEGTAVWASDVTIGSGNIPVQSHELSDGGFINLYHQRAGSFGINSRMFAQRYNSDGVPQWDSPTPLFDAGNTTVFNTTYSSFNEADVTYIGYKLNHDNRFDAYVQRINADGSLPWGSMGMDFDINQTAYEQEVQIAHETGSDFLYALCRYTSSGQGDYGVHIQKFDKISGTRQFTDNSKAVYPLDGTEGGIAPAGNFRVMNDYAVFINSIGTDLNITLLDNNGDFVWPEQYKALATYAANKGNVNLNILTDSELVATFVEDKGPGSQPYAQYFSDTALSIQEVGTTATLQFINPIQDELRLLSNEPIKSVEIYNTVGQLVCKYSQGVQNECRVNSHDWSVGLYHVMVTTHNGTTKTLKIIKN